MKEHFLLSLMLLTMSCASARPMTASPAPAADIALMSAAPTSQQLHDEITASADDLGAAATSMGLSVTTTTTATPLSAETMTKPAETTCAMPPPVKEAVPATASVSLVGSYPSSLLGFVRIVLFQVGELPTKGHYRMHVHRLFVRCEHMKSG